MGNCQAAEAATVVIHHPGNNKIERIYWSLTANQVMSSNPGHYVALVLMSSQNNNSGTMPLNSKHLKLLRPEDTLLIGQVYRLISFEDVLKEFASKKSGKLGKLLKERGTHGVHLKHRDLRPSNSDTPIKMEHDNQRMGNNGSSSNNRGVGRHFNGGSGHWRPALQSIAEIGT